MGPGIVMTLKSRQERKKGLILAKTLFDVYWSWPIPGPLKKVAD